MCVVLHAPRPACGSLTRETDATVVPWEKLWWDERVERRRWPPPLAVCRCLQLVFCFLLLQLVAITAHATRCTHHTQCTVYSVCPKSVACRCHCCSLNLRSLCKMKCLMLAVTSTATATETAMSMDFGTAANAAGYALQTHKITVIVVVFALQRCTERCCHTSSRPSVPTVYYIYSSGQQRQQQQQEKPWNLNWNWAFLLVASHVFHTL